MQKKNQHTVRTERIFLARRRPFALSITAAVLGICSFVWTGCSSSASDAGSDDSEIRILAVTTIPVEIQSSYTQTRRFLGKVESQRRSALGFELQGKVTQLFVDEGEFVPQGSLLAKRDTQRLLAAKAVAEASLLEAEAANTLALNTLDRSKKAYEKNAISVQQLDESEQTAAVQAARLTKIEAEIAQIEVDLEKSQLTAPFDARVSKRYVDEGTVITAGQPVLEIIEIGKVEIRIGLDRQFAQSLSIGDSLEGYWQDTPLALKVERILPDRERITRTIEVIASPIKENRSIREGDLIEIKINSTLETNGMWLPINALAESSRGLWSCFVAKPLETGNLSDATHQLVRHEIAVHTLDGKQAFVNGSFKTGDRVLIEGIHRIAPNQRVRLTDPNTQ